MASALQSLRMPITRTGLMMLSTQTSHQARRKVFQPNVIRNYASGAGGKGGGSKLGLWGALAVAGAGGGYYLYNSGLLGGGGKDYQKVLLHNSYGP